MSKDEHNNCLPNEISKNDNSDCVKENSEFIVRHHAALLETTDNFLYDLLMEDSYLSDLPCGCTHEEILAQIGLVKGQMITVFIERDGLPPLKIVVPQSSATVADLKRGIKSTIILQQNRSAKLIKTQNTNKRNIQNDEEHSQNYNSHSCVSSGNNMDFDHSEIPNIPLPHVSMPPKSAACHKSSCSFSSLPSLNSAVVAAIRSGSTTNRRRKFISWRLIWNTYVLCTVDTNRPLIDGRALLSDFGIGNKSVLKFVKRERIFGRQRRRSLIKLRKVYSFRRDISSTRQEPTEI